MEIILLVFLLNVKSSYLQNTEEPSHTPADTVQFILVNGQAWRIKTFAQDHDVHVWSLGPMESYRFENLSVSNTEKNYGDVLVRHLKITSHVDFNDLERQLQVVNLNGALEISKEKAFAFWVPSRGLYKTQSTPK